MVFYFRKGTKKQSVFYVFYRGAHNLFVLLHRKDVFYGKNNQLAEIVLAEEKGSELTLNVLK